MNTFIFQNNSFYILTGFEDTKKKSKSTDFRDQKQLQVKQCNKII